MNEPSRTPELQALGFEPTYHRVAQTNQWDSAIACIASVAKVPVDSLRQVAVQQFKRPANGRSSVPGKLLPDLFAYYDWWIASRYRDAHAVSDLPELALILLSKKPEQFALFHRQKFENGKPPVAYLINPALGIPESQQYRLDVDAILPCMYLRICLMEEYMKDFLVNGIYKAQMCNLIAIAYQRRGSTVWHQNYVFGEIVLEYVYQSTSLM